jgi:regulator of replication initiation timing
MMANNTTLIEVSAFSGLLGALLTQMMTGIFAYFNDKRKYNHEVRNLYRVKKTEIGENFYYMTGEIMAVIKKNIGYWKNWNDSRSEASLEFLNKEMIKLNTYMDKLKTENWKFNLINLYFKVSMSNSEVIESNARSQQLYLEVKDITDKIRKAPVTDQDALYKQYAVAVFHMCSQYEDLYSKMEHDANLVREEILQDFTIK